MAETPSRKCFNRTCSEVLGSTRSWNGWRLRNGEYSTLCDSCACLYKEGRFCEIFHSEAPGWVPCKSCNKRIHCGCIVSIQNVTLLDDSGIECITCAKKSVHHVPPGNLAYSAPPYGTPFSERIRDLSTKSWSHLSGVGPLQWREAPNLYDSNLAQSESYMRVPHEVGISNGLNRFSTGGVFSLTYLEKRGQLETDWSVSRIARTSKLHVNGNSDSLENEYKSQMAASGSLYRNDLTSQSPNMFHSTHSSEVDLSSETPIRNGRLRGDGKSKSQLLAARYLPRIADVELQQIAGSSEIKPLFEKTLSASDAGRIGRLVVPKKCAEAYFPHISEPEGLPLKVQDVKGKEWVFQFRFWPNNNSRMYVLEGVSAYIQSMQLIAGDKVTFSRLEPEGKLVMGFRKASDGTSTTDHDDEQNKTSNVGDAHAGINLNLSKADKSGYIAKDIANVESSFSRKRKEKNNIMYHRDRHLYFESMDLLELKITLEEAQRLMRPSPNGTSHFVVVENDIEEYEDCPVIGKPTIFTTDQMGKSIQWAQCEDCLKWRRLPADALLTARWTCSNNIWDVERCTCSSTQEISSEQLDDLLFSKIQSVSKKAKITNQDVDTVEALEGLDALANLAISGEGQAIASSGQVTTKHPRHRIGCSCIVCIQPPSGKSLKHKHTCDCTVCLTVKRRFQTLMLWREKKQHVKDAEAASEKHHIYPLMLEKSQENNPHTCEDSRDAPTLKEVTVEGSVDISSVKGQIDLNIKPERDDPLIGSQLNTLKSSNNVAEADDQLKSSILGTVMEVTGNRTKTVEGVETFVDGARVANQHIATPPDAHPEKETTEGAISG